MADLMMYSMTRPDLEAFANNVKDQIADTLKLPILNDHYIVLNTPKSFGAFLKRAFTNVDQLNPDKLVICIVGKPNVPGPPAS